MSTEHDKTSAVVKTAERIGVRLPGPVQSLLDAGYPFPDRDAVRREAIEEIAAAVGSRTYEKVRDAALARLAAASTSASVLGPVGTIVARRRWAAMRDHSEEIVESFRTAPAVVDALATLNDAAPQVPPTVGATSDGLSPTVYRAKFEAERAAEVLNEVAKALAPFYVGRVDHFTPASLQRLMVTALPAEPISLARARQIFDGLHGRRHGGQVAGTRSVVDGLWFAIIAAEGLTFEFADPDGFAVALDRLSSAPRAHLDLTGTRVEPQYGQGLLPEFV